MSISGITPAEVLAIGRLRLWAVDRAALGRARTVEYQRQGWVRRNERSFDARLVRVIDFERALGQLAAEEQAALLAHYRDGHRMKVVAYMMGCSERKASYVLPQARKHLAEVLDRLDLL